MGCRSGKNIVAIAVCGLFAAASPALAQTGHTRQARVLTVTGKGKGVEFKIPQVELPNAAVAKAINRQLVRRIIAPNADSQIDTTASLAQQVREAAALPCCFSGVQYSVLLNQGGLLSLEINLEYHGAYYYERTDHVTFDLNTGRRLTLGDVVADTPAELLSRMHSAINHRMGEELAQAAEDYGDSATVEDLAIRFAWDARIRKVRFASDTVATGASEPDMDEFALTPHSLLLFYRVGLPHGMLNLEPLHTYTFPFEELQPRSIVVPLAKGAKKAKKS